MRLPMLRMPDFVHIKAWGLRLKWEFPHARIWSISLSFFLFLARINDIFCAVYEWIRGALCRHYREAGCHQQFNWKGNGISRTHDAIGADLPDLLGWKWKWRLRKTFEVHLKHGWPGACCFGDCWVNKNICFSCACLLISTCYKFHSDTPHKTFVAIGGAFRTQFWRAEFSAPKLNEWKVVEIWNLHIM